MKIPPKLSFLATMLLAGFAQAEQTQIKLGTGSDTGLYFVTGNAICQFVNRSENHTACKPLASDASVDNLNKIANGQLEMGIVQSDWQYHAYHGTSSFEGKQNDKLRAIFSIYPEPFTLVVRNDSAIQSVDDLQGKKVNVGVDGSGTQATMNVLLKTKGWTEANFKEALKLTPAEMGKALCEKDVDAISYNVGHPNAALKETANSCDIRLIPVTDEVVGKLVAEQSYYAKATIPAKVYKGVEQAVDSFGVYATLVTSSDVSEQQVYRVVKAVFENFDRFKKSHPAFAHLSETEMVKNALSAPLHSGAVKYYKERGWL
ncbi:TAXI family TRAP transporter solute-binding subunit [Actinobacillus equuli]|uniref:TAXI family TRAP transporter solute-binding subunit n=1 Tax=Actinobacillus equuli TaxID=718 RepID=UPI00244360A6|nr:TAXI family TRAP transporter solute-binding subunit [Actinobacillus equuli]WGE46408.1 TAXI family TRAP transporter solute-binding subunit [Actinobacillus equuli subsp. haemolyticus]